MYQNSWTCDLQFLRYRMWQTEIMGYFLPFYQTKNQKIRILKKLKRLLEISSFYTCGSKTTILWCMVPGVRDKIFCHFGPFLTFYHPPSPNNLENQNVEKMKKASRDITIYQKLWLGNVQFLRYSVQQMDGWIDGRKKWHIEVGASPKN